MISSSSFPRMLHAPLISSSKYLVSTAVYGSAHEVTCMLYYVQHVYGADIKRYHEPAVLLLDKGRRGSSEHGSRHDKRYLERSWVERSENVN